MGSSPTPDIKPPALMPDDNLIAQAKRKAMARQKSTGGVASTILSDAGKETLG